MTARRIVLMAAGILLAAGAAVMTAKAFPGAGTVHALPVYGQVPPFTLTDQQGATVTLSSLEGSVWVADFVFTRCAGQCPLMTDRMAALQRAFERDAGVRLVLVDQQGRIRGYYDAMDAERFGRLQRDIRSLLRPVS